MKYTTPNIVEAKGIEPKGSCTDGHTCKSVSVKSPALL